MKKTLCYVLAWLSFALGSAFATAQIEQGKIPDAPVLAKLLPKAISARFMSIAINKTGQALAVGERGIIIRSTDKGLTWQQMPSPVDITLASVFFETDQRVWAVGQAASILRSNDAGLTWKVVRYKPSDLRYYLKVVVRNGIIYIASSDGELWESRDEGVSWQMTTLESGDGFPHLFSLAFVGQTGLLSAERGSVFVRGEMDPAWKLLPTSYNGSYFGVVPFAEQFLLFGMSGRAFLISADGMHQRAIETRTAQFLLDAVVVPEKNQALVVGRGGVIIVVDADGQVVNSYQRPDNADITAVAAQGGDVYLATMKGGISRFKMADLLRAADALPTGTAK